VIQSNLSARILWAVLMSSQWRKWTTEAVGGDTSGDLAEKETVIDDDMMVVMVRSIVQIVDRTQAYCSLYALFFLKPASLLHPHCSSLVPVFRCRKKIARQKTGGSIPVLFFGKEVLSLRRLSCQPRDPE
jgi:hypothetical protein